MDWVPIRVGPVPKHALHSIHFISHPPPHPEPLRCIEIKHVKDRSATSSSAEYSLAEMDWKRPAHPTPYFLRHTLFTIRHFMNILHMFILCLQTRIPHPSHARYEQIGRDLRNTATVTRCAFGRFSKP
jgi:hypothetical protein